MLRLKDKVAIITGGAGDIGKETAKKFLEEGAKVSLVDFNKEALEEANEELSQYGEIHMVLADVTKEDDVINYVKETLDKWGKIDIFFNNAGIESKAEYIVDIDLEDFKKVMEVNVIGSFLGLKHVLPVMIEQKSGSVINTSSDAGWAGSPMLAPYVTSKHAINGLSKTAALEVAKYQIRVNTIHPTGVQTRMMTDIDNSIIDTGGVGLEDLVPFGRYATTSEVADLVVFLASDESYFISGSEYNIDGGMSASSK